MYDGDDPPVFHEVLKPKAAKPHRCDECGRSIEAGEEYERVHAKWDHFQTIKTCRHCVGAKRWLEIECAGYLYEGVYDDLREHFHEQSDLHLGRLIIGMQKKWRKRNGELMDELKGNPKSWEDKAKVTVRR